jgi:hypothetical protein
MRAKSDFQGRRDNISPLTGTSTVSNTSRSRPVRRGKATDSGGPSQGGYRHRALAHPTREKAQVFPTSVEMEWLPFPFASRKTNSALASS